MPLRVMHRQELLRGLQHGVKGGGQKGQLAAGHLILHQHSWNAAGHAVGQKGKQRGRDTSPRHAILLMVEIATHAQQNALPFSTTSSRIA